MDQGASGIIVFIFIAFVAENVFISRGFSWNRIKNPHIFFMN